MDGKVTIYALCEPDGTPRYIGQTRDPEERLRTHITQRTVPGVHGAWITELAQRNQQPTMQVLEVVSEERADEAERRQIAAHLARGCRLTNSTHNRAQNPRRRGGQTARGEAWIQVRIPLDVRTHLEARVAAGEEPSVSWLARKILIDAFNSVRANRGVDL